MNKNESILNRNFKFDEGNNVRFITKEQYISIYINPN